MIKIKETKKLYKFSELPENIKDKIRYDNLLFDFDLRYELNDITSKESFLYTNFLKKYGVYLNELKFDIDLESYCYCNNITDYFRNNSLTDNVLFNPLLKYCLKNISSKKYNFNKYNFDKTDYKIKFKEIFNIVFGNSDLNYQIIDSVYCNNKFNDIDIEYSNYDLDLFDNYNKELINDLKNDYFLESFINILNLAFKNIFDDLCYELKDILYKDYEYRLSDSYLIELCDINNYLFDLDGNLVNVDYNPNIEIIEEEV